jgi:CRP/FNR family transcriptional regulator
MNPNCRFDDMYDRGYNVIRRIMMKTTTDIQRKSLTGKGKNKLRAPIGSLYGVDIFEGIESKELQMLFEETRLHAYPVGTVLFSPGDTCDNLYLLRKGGVELYRLTSEGKRLVTRRIPPGSMFGIMGLFGQKLQGSFGETTKDSFVYVINREDVLAFLVQKPEMVSHILEAVGKRLILLEDRLVESLYSPINIRLAHFLLTNADPVSGELNNITHEEIGDIIGAVRQTVTETLSNMRKQGFIRTGFKKINIIDRRGLEGMIQDSESRSVPDFTVC